MTLLNNKHNLPIFDYYMFNDPQGLCVVNNRNFIIYEKNAVKLFVASPNKLKFLKHKNITEIKSIKVYSNKIIEIKSKEKDYLLKIKNGDFVNYEFDSIFKDKIKLIETTNDENGISVNLKQHKENFYKVIVSFNKNKANTIPTLSVDFEDSEKLEQLKFG